MKKPSLLTVLGLLLVASAHPAHAGKSVPLRSPQAGVLCDRYMCADNSGVSRELTEKHLGRKAAAKLFSQGDFDRTEFTFANGVFCDVKERLCRKDRYYDAQGKRSGAVSERYTRLLFRQ